MLPALNILKGLIKFSDSDFVATGWQQRQRTLCIFCVIKESHWTFQDVLPTMYMITSVPTSAAHSCAPPWGRQFAAAVLRASDLQNQTPVSDWLNEAEDINQWGVSEVCPPARQARSKMIVITAPPGGGKKSVWFYCASYTVHRCWLTPRTHTLIIEQRWESF